MSVMLADALSTHNQVDATTRFRIIVFDKNGHFQHFCLYKINPRERLSHLRQVRTSNEYIDILGKSNHVLVNR